MTAKREICEIDGKRYQRCTSCGELKEISDKNFHKNKNTINGYLSRCKECISKVQNIYYVGNTDYINKRNLERKNNNADKIKLYKEKNKERIREHRAEYNKNSEVAKEYRKRYEQEHKQEILERKKKKRQDMGYGAMHIKTARLIKKLGIRPKVCPICGEERRIEAHHPDNNVRYEIVFCCTQCHQRIHHGWIECTKPINLLEQ